MRRTLARVAAAALFIATAGSSVSCGAPRQEFAAPVVHATPTTQSAATPRTTRRTTPTKQASTSTSATTPAIVPAPTNNVTAPPKASVTVHYNDAPPVPDVSSWVNGQPLGAMSITYDTDADRDWSDLDRWYASKGLRRPPFTAEPRVHRVIAGNRQPDGPQPALDDLLASNVVLENDPITPPGVFVFAHHNVTIMTGGAVDVGGVRHAQPLMGRHAPVVAGDVLTWWVPHGDRTAEYTFRAYATEIIPSQPGEYEKFFVQLPSGVPHVVTYQCHPAGSLAQRYVVRYSLIGSTWTDTRVTWVP